MKTLKKCLSLFLAILTLFSICSVSTTVFAAEYTEQKERTEYFDSALSGYLKNIVDTEDAVSISEKEQVDEVVEEVQNSSASTASTFSLRTASVQSTEETQTAKEAAEELDIDHTRLTLELEDGENVAYLFSEPVSYIDEDGNIVYKDTDIISVTDSSLLDDGYTYQNADNDYKVYFGADSSVGIFLCSDRGSEIRLIPNGTNIAPGYVSSKIVDEIQTPVFEYDGVYGVNSLLRYTPQLNGCKEEIILSAYGGVSRFSFTLLTGDCIAAVNSEGKIEIIDENKSILDTIAAPYAYDASGGIDMSDEHYSECSYELELVEDGVYTLTLVVPEEYLLSENTVYPVTIDPTTSSISQSRDVPVYSKYATGSYPSNETNCFGKSSDYGYGRVYTYFALPDAIADYATINSAYIWMRETTGRTDTIRVRPYIVTSSWSNSMTWNTKASYGDYTCAYRIINSASEDGKGVYWYKFDIKSAVKAWTSGTTNRGLAFISRTELIDGTYVWRAFASRENSTSSYRPYVVINYTNDTTKPTISKVTASPSGWTTGPVTLTVTAKDNSEYGIYRYSFIDGDGWRTTNNKTFTSNQTVYIRVKDHAGNISDRYTYTINTIDPEAPEVTAVSNPGKDTWKNTNITVKITAKDSHSGVVSYSFDNGSNWQSTNSKTYSAEGTYTITAKAKDKVNKVSSAVSGGTVKIDKTAPVVSTPTKSPNTEWSNTNVTVTNNATDALSGIPTSGYSFDGGSTWQTKTKTYSAEGTYTVTPKAKDNAGNIGTGNAITVKIDKTAPTATVTGTVDGDTVDVTVNASDALSGLHATPYSFDGGTTWVTGKSLTLSANATHTIKVRDKATNITTIIYNPKVGTVTASPPLDTWTNGDVTLTASGTNISQYNFDSGAWGTTNSKTYPENTTATVGFKESSGSITYIKVHITNIDKDLPTISAVNVTPETEWTNSEITVSVAANDTLSQVAQYSFDGGTTWQSESSVTYTADVPESVTVMVKDNAGNDAVWGETISLPKYDNELPTAPSVYEQDGTLYISAPSLDETDGSSETLKYQIGDNNEDNYTTVEGDSIELEVVRTYDVPVYAYVVDGAGNRSEVTSFTLENTLGEYTASYTDIALGEGLFHVGFDRTYTSNNGWFFTFDANVQPFTNGYVFTDFYGEKQYFIKNGEGKYLSPNEEELTVNSDSYVLTYGDMTCTFSSDRKLIQIKTDYLETDYTWNDNGTLTITGGAEVTFDEKGNPVTIKITRTDGENEHVKEVAYEWTYLPLGEDEYITQLDSFKDAAGAVHTYAYTNGLLTANETETITYSAEGRVKLISQPNGAFVKYTYNDEAENTEIPNNIGAVTVSDSKGVTDTWYYADGVYISNTLDNYSDNAVYAPGDISNTLTDDNIATNIFYVVERPQEESADGTSGETDAEGTEDTSTDETTAEEETTADESETTEEEVTEETVDETPLYEEIDENTYAFYTYDEQKRVTAELEVLKSNIADITTATFESAEAVAESKVSYTYLSDEDNSITEKISYKKSDKALVIDTKECYNYVDGSVQTYSKYKYFNGDIISHHKYKYVGNTENLIYSEEYEYNECGNVKIHTETQYATDIDALDVTYTTSYTYDVWGMCTETTVTCGEDVDTTITEYDLNGVTLSVTYNDEKVIYTYTDFGTVDKETVVKLDGETETVIQETDYDYDDFGNLKTCTNPDGDTSYYYYDYYGNLTNHNFNGYYFTYNTLGSILTASVNDTVLVEYDYRGAEQELSYIDYKNGQRINYTYDEATGELLAVSQGEDPKFSYSYSTVGKDEITTLTDSINGIIKVIESDKVTVKANADTILYSVENLYEDEETEGSFNGKITTVGDKVYTLKSEENKDTFLVGETEGFAKTYEDDYAGNLWKVNTANAVSTEYGYDEDKNVSTLKNSLNGLIQTFGYGYDDEGNITTETLNIITSDEVGATVETNESISYTYDEDNQLLSAETSSTKWTYSYDDRGNITSKTETDLTTGEVVTDSYTYDTEWLDKLTSYNGQSITYDAVGNPTEYLGHNLEWSFGRQLTQFDTNTYTYNEDGIRTSKTVNGVTTTYYLDGTNIIEQSDGTNTLHFYYDSNDEVIGFTYNEADYFYVKNAMSDIIGIVDSSGNLVVSYEYDPWGKVLSVTGSNVEIGNFNPFRYRSYYYDSDIEMYYLQSRYYDPEVCRFINSDDVNFIGVTGTVGSYNAFAYCENNPVNSCDRFGFERSCIRVFVNDLKVLYNNYSKISRLKGGTDYKIVLGKGSYKKVGYVNSYYMERKSFYKQMGIPYTTSTRYYTISEKGREIRKYIINLVLSIVGGYATKGLNWCVGSVIGYTVGGFADRLIDASMKKPGKYKVYALTAKVKYSSTRYTGIYDVVSTIETYMLVKNKWVLKSRFTTIFMDVLG